MGELSIQVTMNSARHYCRCLSDGIISVHDLTVFAQITTITKTRGASLFAIDLQVRYGIMKIALSVNTELLVSV